MSPRWNWDSPTPLAASECALPPGPKGGGAHSPPIPTTGETLSTLPTLCNTPSQYYSTFNTYCTFQQIFQKTYFYPA